MKSESSTQLSDNFKDPFMNLENSLLSNDEINSTNDYWTNSFEYKKQTDNVNALSRAKLFRFQRIKRLGSNNYDGFTVSGGERTSDSVNIRRFYDARYSDVIFVDNSFASEIVPSFLEILNRLSYFSRVNVRKFYVFLTYYCQTMVSPS